MIKVRIVWEYNVKINYVESKGNSEITKFTIRRL